MAYRLEDARNSGVSDQDSIRFLSEKYGYDYDGAKAAGIADADIITTFRDRGFIDRDYDILGGIKDVGGVIWDTPTQMKASFAAAVEGLTEKDPHAEFDWKDRWIEAGKAASEARAKEPGGESYVVPPFPGFPGTKRSDIREAGGNIGFSGVSMVSGVAGGIVGGALTKSPAGVYGGQALASGVTAAAMDKNQVTRQLLEAFDQEVMFSKGRMANAEERNALLDKTDKFRNKHALWEAVPEAIGNVAEIKLLGGIFREALGNSLGTRMLRNVLSMYGIEVATETETQIGQHNAEVQMGLKPGEELRSLFSLKDQKKSYDEVAPGVFVLTSILSGGSYVAGKITPARKEAQGAPGEGEETKPKPPPPPAEPIVPQNPNMAPGEAELLEELTRPTMSPYGPGLPGTGEKVTANEIARVVAAAAPTEGKLADLTETRKAERQVFTPEERAYRDYQPELPVQQQEARRGEEYARGIRKDEGQLPGAGTDLEGRQEEGRTDLEQPAPGQPGYREAQEGLNREQDEEARRVETRREIEEFVGIQPKEKKAQFAKETEAVHPELRKYTPEQRREIANFEVETNMVREATGETVKVKENAEEALNSVAERRDTYSRLLECLNS